jgi:UbiD family decarboxylase
MTASDRRNTAANITYDDLREWLAIAERMGEVRHVKGVDWKEQIGLAAEAVLRHEDGPCVVFDEVEGSPKGFRLLMNVFAGKRRNMTLGLPEGLDKWELSDAYRVAYLENPRLEKHVMVETGPILENVLEGDDIDLYKFPAPIWHPNDGGRYIGTGTYSITRDPEEQWLNAGAYRGQIHDKRTIGISMAVGHHGNMHRQKYWDKGEPCPIVMIVGGDPLAFFAGGTESPYGMFELDMVGGMRGRPCKMVTGRHTGLPFPANAEIVLEGFITREKTQREGPFGEWTGHYNAASMLPVVDIKAIYHRNDPILLGVPPMGGGSDEMARYRAVMRSAMIKQNMTNAGVPGITKVWCHEVGGSRMLHAIAIDQRYPGHATQAGFVAAQCGGSAYASKYVVVLDDDIDVTSLEQTIWAMVARSDPKESIQFIEGSWDSRADPRMEPEKRKIRDVRHSVAVIDACKPYKWRDQFPDSNAATPEMAKKAKEMFGWLMEK